MTDKNNKPAGVIIFNEEKWTAEIVSDKPLSLTCTDTLRCVWLCLRCGKGSLIRRIASVLRRLFTCSLKPSQVVSSRKRGIRTLPRKKRRTRCLSPHSQQKS